MREWEAGKRGVREQRDEEQMDGASGDGAAVEANELPADLDVGSHTGKSGV